MSYYNVLKPTGAIEKVEFTSDDQEELFLKKQTLYEAVVTFFKKPLPLTAEKIDGFEQTLERSDSETEFNKYKTAILDRIKEDLFLDQLAEEEVYPLLDKTRIDYFQYFKRLRNKTWNDYGSSEA